MAEKRVALLKRANKLFRQGKADAAIKEYKKILAIKPDDLEVRRIVGDLELRENNLDGAIEQFEWIADYYLKEGFFAKAIAMYKRITRVNPKYEGALIKLADLYTKQGLVMEAKHIYLDIAEECKRQNNQKKALDMYKKILEFDRSNIKMRLLLADNYLKEGLQDNAISEYLTTADIMLNKKDFTRAEELLLNTHNKIHHNKIIEKLVLLYNKQDEDDKAITLLSQMGDRLNQNTNLLKVLGELYLKKGNMNEAEIIFSRIVDIAPEEIEIIMRLGKVYIQREDYDKTFKLFLPIIDKNIAIEKFEEATSLLRFIIASDNTYIPALIKLAEIFKLSNKTNNLIALYESLIPIYEQKKMRDQLKQVLEELIRLSDTPFSYEEQLARLDGKTSQVEDIAESEKEGEREKEFVSFNLRLVNDALKTNDINKAINILVKSKATFPRNTEIREKLFDIYQNQTEMKEKALDEGKALIELYKFSNRTHEYQDLIHKLSILEPGDEKLVALSGEEKTSIDIDFSQVDLQEQIQEISDSAEIENELVPASEESDVMLLSEAESFQLQSDADMIEPLTEPPPTTEDPHSLSSVLAEVDFYVNDGYFGDAENLIQQLKDKYPDNRKLIEKIERLQKAKEEAHQKGELDSTDAGLIHENEPTGTPFELQRQNLDKRSPSHPSRKTTPPPLEFEIEPSSGPVHREHTERIKPHPPNDEFNLEPSFENTPGSLDYQSQSQDPSVVIDIPDMDASREIKIKESSGIKFSEDDFSLDEYMKIPPPETTPVPPKKTPTKKLPFIDQPPLFPNSEPEMDILSDFEPEPIEEKSHEKSRSSSSQSFLEDSSMLKISEQAFSSSGSLLGEFDEAEDEEDIFELPPANRAKETTSKTNHNLFKIDEEEDVNIFEIESSIAEESQSAQEHENSKINIKLSELDLTPPKTKPTPRPPSQSIPFEDLEIEVDIPRHDEDDELLQDIPIDKDLLIQSPSVDPREKTSDSHSTSGMIEFDLNSIMIEDEADYDIDSPFKEDISSPDLDLEDEEDLLSDEPLIVAIAYLELEKNALAEKEAISFWLKELEKQRTSTIEKNMMEIFEEFKRGVDEKIGQEDYDTRYNLGIAYKEMGLLEEAIHEFLISAKHPLKFFDSAGLLGMCFREKGMFTEAVSWFERALETPERRKEEYLAVRYELVITLKLKEDYRRALKLCVDILKIDQSYRDVADIYRELKGYITR